MVSLSRSMHRGTPLVTGAFSSWPWWPAKHRARIRRCVRAAVLSGMTSPVRVGLGGREIDVDSLATELVIDRCLAHEVTP